MPNKNTFTIPSIRRFILSGIDDYRQDKKKIVVVDAFANICPLKDDFKGKDISYLTNDLDKEMDTDFHYDAIDFLKIFESESVDIVLYDPPFSPRQISECYKKLGLTVNMETTQASFWSNLKKEISRIVKKNGQVYSFGWNSNGVGKNNGFRQDEIMLVSHGGNHNDTICTKEIKE